MTAKTAVLVVEDEELMRRLIQRALERGGYRALCVPSAEDALARLAREDGFALALVDVTLPGMSGVDLASILRRERPAMRLLFITGADTITARALWRQGPVLPKPFTPMQLLDAVKGALEMP